MSFMTKFLIRSDFVGFELRPGSSMFLNGKPRKLVGNNRHQDYLAKGNALRDEMHVRDILLMKQMGSNFLRVSHYPQDPVIMEMCDKLGIVWVNTGCECGYRYAGISSSG